MTFSARHNARLSGKWKFISDGASVPGVIWKAIRTPSRVSCWPVWVMSRVGAIRPTVPVEVPGPSPTPMVPVRAQARDEHRHARFFDRVAAEVAAIPGADIAARQDVLRTLISPELVALFEERLPATARRLAEDREGLTAAVGLYHMVLEGVVLLAGQNALLDTLERLSVGLPGVRRGVELVLRDERWHIGFGTRLVQGSGLGQEEVEAILALGQAASGAWGDLVSPNAAERAVRMHRNRLRTVGRKFL